MVYDPRWLCLCSAEHTSHALLPDICRFQYTWNDRIRQGVLSTRYVGNTLDMSGRNRYNDNVRKGDFIWRQFAVRIAAVPSCCGATAGSVAGVEILAAFLPCSHPNE